MAYKDVRPFTWYAPRLLDNGKTEVIVDLLIKRYDPQTDKFVYKVQRNAFGSFAYQSTKKQQTDLQYQFDDLPTGRIVAWMYTGEDELNEPPIIADVILKEVIRPQPFHEDEDDDPYGI